MKERAPDGTLPPSSCSQASLIKYPAPPLLCHSPHKTEPVRRRRLEFRRNPNQETNDLFEEGVMWGADEPESRDLPLVVQERTTDGASRSVRSPSMSIPARKVKKSGVFGGGYSEEVNEEEMVPPHIIIERRLAEDGRKTSFSVVTGNGRTLKGRDLRKVRNSVLMQTGFLEGRVLPSNFGL